MDINATLHRMREIVGDFKACTPECVNVLERHDGELFDLFEAMDKWISSGGFLPDAWKGNR